VDPTMLAAVGLSRWEDLVAEMDRDRNEPDAKDGPTQWLWLSTGKLGTRK